jgi:hypothetical protein
MRAMATGETTESDVKAQAQAGLVALGRGFGGYAVRGDG